MPVARYFLLALSFSFVSYAAEPTASDTAWTPLFNGHDTTGWETWLGTPPGGDHPLGLNNDPLHVFTVEDGAIHVSGQIFGGISTLAVYGNYHLRLEQRWGESRWPPREHAIRDSGICYHGSQHGAFQGNWMSSIECQVQEGEIGDTYLLAGPAVDVRVTVEEFFDAGSGKFRRGRVFHADAPLAPVASGRIVRSHTADAEYGAWNRIEIICTPTSCTHIVNGITVMVTENPHVLSSGQVVPLSDGHIQLQSEGAEVWYRNIQLRPLSP